MNHSDSRKSFVVRFFALFGSVRRRSIIILICTFLASFLLLQTVSKFVLMQSFRDLEMHNARHSLHEINNAIQSRLEQLDTINRDWAWWDDSCAFIEKGSPAFVSSNLTDETFANMKLDLMGFFDSEGLPVSLTVFDRSLGRKIEPPQAVLAYFAKHPELVTHGTAESFHRGLVRLPHGPLLFTSRPILTSEHQGPVRGALVFGRYLDGGEAGQIAEREQLVLSVSLLPLAQGTTQQREVVQTMQRTGEKLAVLGGEEDSICAFLQLDDIYGEPLLLFDAKLQRSIYKRGLETGRVLRWFFLLVSVVICLVVALLLDHQVVTPLMRLNEEVSRIRGGVEAEARVNERGPVEIRRLSASINGMLDSLSGYSVELDRRSRMLAAQNGDILAANSRMEEEIAERRELEKERERLIAELQEALAQVKTLSGFLPICASCKKIRDDEGYWNQIEAYIGMHADVQFSHSICPDCLKKLYGDVPGLSGKK